MQSPKRKMGVTILWLQALENSLVSVLDAFWLHFGPRVVPRGHLGSKIMRKWTPNKAQGPQNDEKVMQSGMEF